MLTLSFSAAKTIILKFFPHVFPFFSQPGTHEFCKISIRNFHLPLYLMSSALMSFDGRLALCRNYYIRCRKDFKAVLRTYDGAAAWLTESHWNSFYEKSLFLSIITMNYKALCLGGKLKTTLTFKVFAHSTLFHLFFNLISNLAPFHSL